MDLVDLKQRRADKKMGLARVARMATITIMLSVVTGRANLPLMSIALVILERRGIGAWCLAMILGSAQPYD
jgi:hypothetical protein